MPNQTSGLSQQRKAATASTDAIQTSNSRRPELAEEQTKFHTVLANSAALARLLDVKVETLTTRPVPLVRNFFVDVYADVTFLKAARKSASRKSEWREIAPFITYLHIEYNEFKCNELEEENLRVEAVYLYWMNYCLSWMRLSQIYTKVLQHHKREIPKFASDVCAVARLPELKASTLRNLSGWSEHEWEGEWDFGERSEDGYTSNKYPRLYKRAEMHASSLYRERCISQGQGDK